MHGRISLEVAFPFLCTALSQRSYNNLSYHNITYKKNLYSITCKKICIVILNEGWGGFLHTSMTYQQNLAIQVKILSHVLRQIKQFLDTF